MNQAQIIKDLESMLLELVGELAEARFQLGKLPSDSDALCMARDYLQSTLVKDE